MPPELSKRLANSATLERIESNGFQQPIHQRDVNSMPQWPDTEATLVRRLADRDDDAAWNRFDLLYRPVIYRYARSSGLQHSDAETIVAEVMTRVFRAAQRWASPSDSQRPDHFRAWLQRVSKNALLNLVTRQLQRRGTGGTSHQLNLAGRPEPDDAARSRWEHQHRQHVFRIAAREVQATVDEDHWAIFWQTHVEGRPANEAAKEFGHSIGSVYAIRSRLVKRLRIAVDAIESLSHQTAGGIDQ